jgi:hypothetical protein
MHPHVPILPAQTPGEPELPLPVLFAGVLFRFEYRGVVSFKGIFLRLICLVSEFGKIQRIKFIHFCSDDEYNAGNHGKKRS